MRPSTMKPSSLKVSSRSGSGGLSARPLGKGFQEPVPIGTVAGGFFEPREEGRVHAEFSLVDLHYQIREFQDSMEQRLDQQATMLKRLEDRSVAMAPIAPLAAPPALGMEPAEGRRSSGNHRMVSISSDASFGAILASNTSDQYESPIVNSPREASTEDHRVSTAPQELDSDGGLPVRERPVSTGSGERQPRNSAASAASSILGGVHWSSLQSFVWDDSGGKQFQEKAKKQAQRLRASRADSLHTKRMSRATRVVSSNTFTNGIMILVLINVILLGYEVDLAANLGIKDVPAWLSTVNAVFVSIFLVELILRFTALGWRGFWCGEESSWNIFDFVVITVSVLDVCLDYFALFLQPSFNTGQLRLIRAIRLARALRGIRIVWLFEYVGALRTLALSIISTSGSLFWTIVILLILVYSFGVVTTQLVVEHCRELAVEASQDPNAIPQCPESLSRYWASVSSSMLTLYSSISGGLDWESAIQPLKMVSPLAVGLVLLYVTITVFAVLNVVIGVFCNTAIENAHADKELASIKQVYTKTNQVHTLKKIFYEIDSSGAEEVSIEDLEEAMKSGELSSFLESMGISTDDVWTLCILLDSDRSGTIDLEEFVTGCMQLHGPAKSMQLAKMSFENRSQRRMLQKVTQDIHMLKSILNANMSKEQF